MFPHSASSDLMEPSFLAGVVEGFYGQPWSQSQRFQLFDDLASWGMNTYFYAPKDDLKHRALWRECYTSSELEALDAIVTRCGERGLRFVYGLSPGLDVRFQDADDRQRIRDRLQQILALGVRCFALLFDDLPGNLTEADSAAFGSVAGAQCDVANEVLNWLMTQDSDCQLLFCPTPYCDRMDRWNLGGTDYLSTVGSQLAPAIDVLWTGPEIISGQIPVDSIRAVRARLQRPPIIWDNLHANDYDAQRAYCGPYSGRSPELLSEVRGVLANPNCQSALNYVPLHTLATYLRDPCAYDPRQAYLAAMNDWLPRFATIGEPFELADLTLLGDCFYLPHEHGPLASSFHERVRWLVRNPTNAWDATTEQQFAETCRQIESIFQKLTELRDRELFYAWSRRVWDLKEEVDLFSDVMTQKRQGGDLAIGIYSETHLPRTYRGGIVGDLRRLLDFESSDGRIRLPAKSEFALIRDARLGDEPGAYYVCLKTGDHGKDGEPFYGDDPDALGRIYTGPYLAFCPKFSLVLEDDWGICGYALAAFDSRQFFERYEREWRPKLVERFPMPTGDPSAWSRTQEAHQLYHEPDYYCPEPYDEYPSHLHIDLLRRAQGRGHGRRMIEELVARLRTAGSPGVHLGMSEKNDDAFGFYQALGFRELTRHEDAIYMGMRL